MVMAASDAIRNLGGYRAQLRRQDVSGVALLSKDAARRTFAGPYDLVLALAPVRERCVIDARPPGRTLPVGGTGPVVARCARDAATAGRLLVRGLTSQVEGPPKNPSGTAPAGRSWILALWRDAPDAGAGGAVSHVAGILGGFRQLGWRVALVTNGSPPEPLRAAVDVVEMAAPLPRGSRFTRESAWVAANDEMCRTALDVARRMPPAFVYERNAFLTRAGADVSRRLGTPFVLEWNASAVWEHRHWYRQSPAKKFFAALGERYERYTTRSADVVAAVSRGAATMATDVGADPASIAVVANAVDAADVPEPAPKDPRPGALLGWAGSFGHWHGVEAAIECLCHLPRDVELVMVGDGERREACEQMAARLGLGGRITWTGSLPRAEALRVLSGCDVLLSPHVWKGDGAFFGSPTKVFEYMALGRPIVASRLEQIGEILVDAVTAMLTQPGDPKSLAAGVTRALELPDRGAAMGLEARRQALAEHTWDKRAAQILSKLSLPSLPAPRPVLERG
ncbi:glycosyltransferase [Streptomyces sp. TP-A0356]|uniref:glycosyltransferase n=1 Tax=Streptomyces sp. TP-A0356 TaxID=1359208 RepID=UPI0006E46698|nr:glycosyltransferase [Streptomyces sp. TP-A0356]